MEIDTVFDLIRQTDKLTERFVLNETDRTSAAELGLDARCGYLHLTPNCVIVEKCNDSRLQYYGGFEYVDKENRKEIGDYVFYLADNEDGRVAECINRFYNTEKVDA